MPPLCPGPHLKPPITISVSDLVPLSLPPGSWSPLGPGTHLSWFFLPPWPLPRPLAAPCLLLYPQHWERVGPRSQALPYRYFLCSDLLVRGFRHMLWCCLHVPRALLLAGLWPCVSSTLSAAPQPPVTCSPFGHHPHPRDGTLFPRGTDPTLDTSLSDPCHILASVTHTLLALLPNYVQIQPLSLWPEWPHYPCVHGSRLC